MITFNATQQAIIASNSVDVSWLWEVTPTSPINGTATFRWSTKKKTFAEQVYTAEIIPESFDGVIETRSRSEYGIQAPNDLRFDIKYDQAHAPSFKDAEVALKLVMGATIEGAYHEAVVRSYKFVVKNCFAQYGRLKFSCVDFIQRHMEGDYPNTPLVSDIFPSTGGNGKETDNLCVPVPFGTCYIPLRSVYFSGARYYLLGPSGHTFTIDAVHSPDNWPGVSEWASASHAFTQSTLTDADGNNWQVFQPIIADSDGDGTNDACGLWYDNGIFLDMPTKFSDSATASMTNFADLIAYVLEDMGVPAADIDTGTGSSFEAAAATFALRNLTCNGAFYYRQKRKDVLSRLLNMCGATLVVRDKIQLHVLSATSMQTVTSSHVLRESATEGPGSFKIAALTASEYDSGYVSFQEAGRPQSTLLKARVPATTVGAYDNPSAETLAVDFVQNSAHVRKAGILYFQRKFTKDANVGFAGKHAILALEPDDMITISGDLYGGTYPVLIDEMVVKPNASVELKCIRFRDTLYDWGDLADTPLSYASEDALSSWSPVVSGPDSAGSNLSNKLSGRLWVGESILLDSNKFSGQGALQLGTMLAHDSPFNIHDKLYWDHELEALFARNLWVSGELHASVMSIDETHATGGTMLLSSGAALGKDATTPPTLDSQFIITVNDPPSGAIRLFNVGDFLQMKTTSPDGGTIEAWMVVDDYSESGFSEGYRNNADGTASYLVRLKYGSLITTFPEGTAVVSYGNPAARKILMSSDKAHAPYIDIFTTGEEPWNSVKTTTRLGNLAGIDDPDFGEEITGEGLYSDNVYLKGKLVVAPGSSGISNFGDYQRFIDQNTLFLVHFDVDLKATSGTEPDEGHVAPLISPGWDNLGASVIIEESTTNLLNNPDFDTDAGWTSDMLPKLVFSVLDYAANLVFFQDQGLSFIAPTTDGRMKFDGVYRPSLGEIDFNAFLHADPSTFPAGYEQVIFDWSNGPNDVLMLRIVGKNLQFYAYDGLHEAQCSIDLTQSGIFSPGGIEGFFRVYLTWDYDDIMRMVCGIYAVSDDLSDVGLTEGLVTLYLGTDSSYGRILDGGLQDFYVVDQNDLLTPSSIWRSSGGVDGGAYRLVEIGHGLSHAQGVSLTAGVLYSVSYSAKEDSNEAAYILCDLQLLDPQTEFNKVTVDENGYFHKDAGTGTWLRMVETFYVTVTGTYEIIFDAHEMMVGEARYGSLDKVQLEQKPFGSSFVDGSRALDGKLKYSDLVRAPAGSVSLKVLFLCNPWVGGSTANWPEEQVILDWSNGPDDRMVLRTVNDSGSQYLQLYISDGTNEASCSIEASSELFPGVSQITWMPITFTWEYSVAEGLKLSLHCSNVSDQEVFPSFPFFTGTSVEAPLHVGTDYNFENVANVRVDELRIDAVARSDLEIEQWQNSTYSFVDPYSMGLLPTYLGLPRKKGVYLSGDYVGFFNGNHWGTFIDGYGNIMGRTLSGEYALRYFGVDAAGFGEGDFFVGSAESGEGSLHWDQSEKRLRVDGEIWPADYRHVGGFVLPQVGPALTHFTDIATDDDHIYIAGHSSLGNDAYLAKIDRASLTVETQKLCSITDGQGFRIGGIHLDGNYLYAAGYYSDTSGTTKQLGIVLKCNKEDLSVADSVCFYSGTSARPITFKDVVTDSSYVYAIGHSEAEGGNYNKGLIVRLSKTDLSLSTARVYSYSTDVIEFAAGQISDSSLYVVGKSKASGQERGLVVSIDLTDMSAEYAKVYGGDTAEDFRGVYVNDTNVFVAGVTSSEGQGLTEGLVLKFNKSLVMSSRKIYGSAQPDFFNAITGKDGFIYVAGGTKVPEMSVYQGLIVRYDDYLLDPQAKILGSYTQNNLNSLHLNADGGLLYSTCYSERLLALNTDFGLGSFPTTPAKFAFTDIFLEDDFSFLTLSDVTLTVEVSQNLVDDVVVSESGGAVGYDTPYWIR